MIAMSHHHGRRGATSLGAPMGAPNNWKQGPAICRNTVRILQEALDRAVPVASGRAYSVTLTACHGPDTMAKPDKGKSGPNTPG